MKMDEELLGIVGGMGPYTDVYFLDRLIALNKEAGSDQDYPRTLLYSNTKVPCRVSSFPHAKDAVVSEIVEGFDKLGKAGATLGVMTCNTAHIYYEEIESKVNYPLINIVEQTTKVLSQSVGTITKSIGVLATEATVNFDLYGKSLGAVGISAMYPTKTEQELISKVIFDPQFGVKATIPNISGEALRNLASVMAQMKKRYGIEKFLAGCTELSIAFNRMKDQEFDLIDPLVILASACLEKLYFANKCNYPPVSA